MSRGRIYGKAWGAVWGTILAGGLLLAATPAFAECTPDPAGDGDTVTCTGVDSDGFDSNADDLTVDLVPGALISSGQTLALGGFDETVNVGAGASIDGFASLYLDYWGVGGLDPAFVVDLLARPAVSGHIINNDGTIDYLGIGDGSTMPFTLTNRGVVNTLSSEPASADIVNSGIINSLDIELDQTDNDLLFELDEFLAGNGSDPGFTVNDLADRGLTKPSIVNVKNVAGGQIGEFELEVEHGTEGAATADFLNRVGSIDVNLVNDPGATFTDEWRAIQIYDESDARQLTFNAKVVNRGAIETLGMPNPYGGPGAPYAIYIDGEVPLDSTIVDNSGLIDGDVFLGSGPGEFIQRQDGVSTGVTDGGGDVDGLTIEATGPGRTDDGGNYINFEEFVKTGAGTLTATGTWDFGATGTGLVTDGTLALDGTFIAQTLTVQSGATLGGTGTVTGTVTGAGIIGPGFSPGDLTILGDLDLTAGGLIDLEIDGPGAYDRLFVGGDLLLSGAEIRFVLGDLFEFDDLSTYFTGGLTDFFFRPGGDAVTDLTLFSGANYSLRSGGSQYDLSFASFDSFDGARLTEQTAAIPEPATLALFGIGLAGLGLMHRRRRKPFPIGAF